MGMETIDIHHEGLAALPGARPWAVVGVVASGNLEILLERATPADICEVRVETSVPGFTTVWRAVIDDFVMQNATGGLRISINDSGARPDTVSLRLLQGLSMMGAP
ncbi:MAG TPA: malonate decarboxylase acyl carrier protein [Acidisoma sp.]|jgi:malonate decarboxylase delta subunit|nr:malonate decarboxylase acyl carrier protein [Acidisoma sp.]